MGTFAANIFASPKTQSGFTPYVGEGFLVNLPAKWNPSKEVEFPGQVLRYEDNFDATNNLSVSIVKTDKSSIKDYGSPEELLKSVSALQLLNVIRGMCFLNILLFRGVPVSSIVIRRFLALLLFPIFFRSTLLHSK